MLASERESSVEWGDPVLILAKADYHQRRWWNRSEEEKAGTTAILRVAMACALSDTGRSAHRKDQFEVSMKGGAMTGGIDDIGILGEIGGGYHG